MGGFLYKFIGEKTLVLIIALLFYVYNSYAQNEKGVGRQKPVEITGLLAASLLYFNVLINCANGIKFACINFDSHTVDT